LHGRRGLPNARQDQRNREIATVLHMSVRAPGSEKWRSIGDWRGRRRLDGGGFHRRKVWQTGGLRSSTVRSERGEMALWTLEKAPFIAISHPFFDDFRRVFLRVRPSGRKLARMQPRKALVGRKSGQERFAGTARRVLRTKRSDPFSGPRRDLEPVTVPCPTRAAASLGPGLRTASGAKRSLGINFPADGHPEEDIIDALRGGVRGALPEGDALAPHLPRVHAARE